jgi:hypothetical protein
VEGQRRAVRFLGLRGRVALVSLWSDQPEDIACKAQLGERHHRQTTALETLHYIVGAWSVTLSCSVLGQF